MSTELQQYSIANQSAAIALYAAAHNIGIIHSFVDEGKSGTTIKKRKGLQELLRVVQSGEADFDQILVYDVSRWGRFPASDESAHYEYLCKQAGIAVHYCAEQFDNDNSTASNLLKALKRAMAGEFSRELSVKLSQGMRRLASMGYWQGGVHSEKAGGWMVIRNIASVVQALRLLFGTVTLKAGALTSPMVLKHRITQDSAFHHRAGRGPKLYNSWRLQKGRI
jgi:DNA invertase Pin-like site-specific DNA recombinase